MTKNVSSSRSWFCLSTRKRRHLRWLTIIIGVMRVREADVLDLVQRRAISAQIAGQVEDFRKSWTALARGRRLNGLTWRGVVEIDVRRSLDPDGHAAALMTALGVDTSPLAADERLVVPHVHLVLDGAGRASDDDRDGSAWANETRSVLSAAWRGPWRVLLKGLRQDQTVREALTALHGYCHKDIRCYVASGGWGDQPTHYGDPWEWHWSRLVTMVYGSIDRDLRSRK